jgi:serine/threonine protein kinase/TolB-like protein
MGTGKDTTGSAGHDETLAATPTPAPVRGDGPLAYAPGDLVAERYRVVRPLGEGGMGEVYEAEDLLLHERVALKTVRAVVAADETTILRFKREIQLARKVTHPNVCRIFDVGLDRREGREHAFLTMELLEGETLSARLKRAGKLAPEEAQPIAEQIAAALGAAHAAGVIHRDLKSANVIVVGAGPRVRAVVTDFGLARAAVEGGDQVTGDGGVVGSPAYMAPEQVEGGRNLTPAADVYALGVVMFEMVTGRLPFIGDTPLATAVMRLREDAPTPRSVAPEVDARWERAIVACLRRRPEERPASALEVAQLLRGEKADAGAAPVEQPKPKKPRRLRRVVGGLAIAFAVVAIANARYDRPAPSEGKRAGSRLPAPPAPPAPPLPPAGAHAPPAAARAEARQRRSVAILPLLNTMGRKEVDYVSTAVGEMLTTELAAGDELRTVAGESVARARQQLGLTTTETYAPDTLRKLRRLLDADYVVIGSYTLAGDDRVRIDLRLQETRRGETVASTSETGRLDDLSSIVESLGETLRESLDVSAPSEDERQGARALMPRGDVTRLYSEGLSLLRVDHCAAARGPLEQAVAVDPKFALAHQALSEVLDCLGYDGRALEHARRAAELAEDLPAEVRLQVEAHLHKITDQPDKALAAYEQLFAAAPDNYDFGLKLLRVQRHADPDAAKKTIARLRDLASQTGESPELDFAEALLEGTDAAKLAGLAKASAEADAQGARLVAASARLSAANIQLRVGDLDEALDEARRAKAIFEASGDRDGVIQALQVEALVHQKRKDGDAARRALREATELGKHLDSVRSLAGLEESLGDVLLAQGDLQGAEAAFKDVVKLQARGGKHEAVAYAHLDLARVKLYRGELDDASEQIDHAVAAAKKAESPRAQGIAAYASAIRALVAGEAEEARERFDAALERSPELRELGLDKYFAGELALLQRDWPAAEAAARGLLGRSKALKDLAEPLAAERILLEALVRRGKLDEARALVARLEGGLGEDDAFRERLVLGTFAARLRAASKKPGDRVAAVDQLASVAKRAAHAGYVVLRLEADLARGRLQLDPDQRGAGHALLAQVVREARRRGLGALAGDATEALRGK